MSVSIGNVWTGTAGEDASEADVPSGMFLRQARKLVFARGRGRCSPPGAASSGDSADIRALERLRTHPHQPILVEKVLQNQHGSTMDNEGNGGPEFG